MPCVPGGLGGYGPLNGKPSSGRPLFSSGYVARLWGHHMSHPGALKSGALKGDTFRPCSLKPGDLALSSSKTLPATSSSR